MMQTADNVAIAQTHIQTQPQRVCPCCGRCPACGHGSYPNYYPFQYPVTYMNGSGYMKSGEAGAQSNDGWDLDNAHLANWPHAMNSAPHTANGLTRSAY